MSIEAIWQEYRTALLRFLRSRVENPDDVDDLLQEILIKSYKNLHSLQSQASVKSWVFQIANNVIVDYYRKKAKGQGLKADELWYDTEESPDIKKELSHCLLPFIKALPEETAQLLTAIDLEGKKQKDYAEAHNISYSTLKSRVQKGRQQLRDLFEDCCHFSMDKDGNLIEYVQKGSDCGGCS